MSKVVKNIKKTLLSLLVLGMGTSGMVGCSRTGIGAVPNSEVKSLALIVVPNKGRVDVLDTQINRVIQSLKTDDGPSSIAVSPDGRQILVTNTTSGTVSVFLRRDNETFQELNPVGSGVRPIGIAFNPNSQLYSEAYVAYEGSGSDGKILILDTRDKSASPKIRQVISLPDSQPRKIVVSKDGNRVFITDGLNDRIITLVKTGNNFSKNFSQPFDQNRANVDLQGMVADDQDRLFIANGARSDVYVFNGRGNAVAQNITLQDNQVVGTEQVGPKNLLLYKNPQTNVEKLYVTGYNASVVSVIDPKNLRLLRNIRLYQNVATRDSYNPVGINIGSSSSKDDVIYVTNASGLTITLIDPATDTLKRNISPVESAGAQDPLGEVVTIGAVK